jgi:hypothetical protein
VTAPAIIPAAPGWIVSDDEGIRPVVGWAPGGDGGPVVWDALTWRVEVAEGGDVSFSLSAYQAATLRETAV